jgi:hypothetical protein
LSFIFAINLESLDLWPVHPVLEGETMQMVTEGT